MSRIVKVAAVITLGVAVIVASGLGSFTHEEVLLPLGLFLWCLSEA